MKTIRISSLLLTLILGLYFLWMPKDAEALSKAKMDLEQGHYQMALDILEQQDVDPLVLGNVYYQAGNALSNAELVDVDGQQELYAKALDTYLAGMAEEPQRIDLKYNYEYVKKQLDDQQQDSQKNDPQNQDNPSEDSDQDQQNKDNQSGDSDQDQPNKEDQQGDSEQNSQSNEGSNNNSDQSQQNQDGTHEDQGSKGQETDADPSEQLAEAMMNQVLKMLEDQEQDSLKNNQQVISRQEEGGKNDW